jgi:hypothetical protein
LIAKERDVHTESTQFGRNLTIWTLNSEANSLLECISYVTGQTFPGISIKVEAFRWDRVAVKADWVFCDGTIDLIDHALIIHKYVHVETGKACTIQAVES